MKPATQMSFWTAMVLVAYASCAGTLQRPVAPDRIVFSSFRPANWDLYLFAAPGTTPKRLTNDPNLDYDGVFSPDGRWVVFTSERYGSPDLFALDLSNEMAEPRLLIESDAMEDQAAFSPSGKELAFVGTAAANADVYRIQFLPDRVQTMTMAEKLTDDPRGDFRPAYSPDGTRLTFSSDRDTPPLGHPFFAFARQREGEIYVLELATRIIRRMTHSAGWDGSPSWSEDGKTILFYSAGGKPNPPSPVAVTQEGGFRIWAVPLAGGSPSLISPEGSEALSPKLTRDGRLAFVTRSGQGYEADWSVVSVAMDGSDVRPESDRSSGCWSPDFNRTTGAMICHGPGPVEKSGIMSRGFGVGPLVTPGFPVETTVLDRRVALYPMRHAFAVPPHPHQDTIIVQGEMDGFGQLLLGSLDGNNSRELVRIQSKGQMPIAMSWSKNGDWITYTVGPFFGAPTAASDVWRVRPDGSGVMNLTNDSTANDGLSEYSHDGKRLVFRSGRGEAFDLYLMNEDGTDIRQLTNDPWKENFPAFSPTEDLVAFVSDRDGTPGTDGYRDFEIYTLAIDPNGAPGILRRITRAPGQDAHPQFSPDGKWLIFTSERGGINDEEPLVQEILFAPQIYGEIFAYRLADGMTIRLTHNKWEDGAPFWVGPADSRDKRLRSALKR